MIKVQQITPLDREGGAAKHFNHRPWQVFAENEWHYQGRQLACVQACSKTGKVLNSALHIPPVAPSKQTAANNDANLDSKFEQILGIRFFNSSVPEAIEYFLLNRGLLAIPAAPALSKLQSDESYRRALQGADLVLLDSGLIAMAWHALTGRSVATISGIQYLDGLLGHELFRTEATVMWLVGSDAIAGKARDRLLARGFDVQKHYFQVLPSSQSEEEHSLLLRIEEQRPGHIILTTGGGSQEKLGLYLRNFLLYRPCLHCVGAALTFLIGTELAIPAWAERMRIGWLFRFVSQPRMILPRLGIALGLVRMLLRDRAELPALRPRWVDV